jgi:uncharacterized protein (DUF924 family)
VQCSCRIGKGNILQGGGKSGWTGETAGVGVDDDGRDQILPGEQRGFLYKPLESIREQADIHGSVSLLRTQSDEKYQEWCRH